MTKMVGLIEMHLDEGALRGMVKLWLEKQFPYLTDYDVVNLSATTLKLSIREQADEQLEGKEGGDQSGLGQPKSARRAPRTP